MSRLDMRVTKRNGELEDVAFDKILNRIRKLGLEANIHINYPQLVMKVIDQLYDTIPTTKIDELAAEQCAALSTLNPDYGILSARIIVSNHQKNTEDNFYNVMKALYNFIAVSGEHKPLLSDAYWEFVRQHGEALNHMIDYNRDYLIDYFGFKTLERAYLFRIGNKIVERPQHMWLRVAVEIHRNSNHKKLDTCLNLIKETYDLMSQKYFTHATPTLFNSGTPRPQMSSCYLISMEEDSIDGIFNTLKDCAHISKWAGGIGLHIHNVRAKGTHIQGTNGSSNGIVPMLRVFNNAARYVDQCVHPDTMIYTTEGPRSIQHCSLGKTKIFNLKGETEVIQNVLEHPYDGELFYIKTDYSIDSLKITPEHPVYVLRAGSSHSDYEWIEAKELLPNDLLVSRIPSKQCDEDIASIVGDDCKMYGILLAHGIMNNWDQCASVFLKSDKQLHDFVCAYLASKCVQYNVEIIDDTHLISWKKTLNMTFRYSDLYNMSNEKHVDSKWLNLPIEKSKYILAGILESAEDSDSYFEASSYSRLFIESIRFLCLKLGVPAGSGFLHKAKYVVKIPKTQDICELMGIPYKNYQFNFRKQDDYLLCPITSITSDTYTGTLYDLQMKTEHNYLIHNGLVHNGGGKRSGSFAIYLEPWHADVCDFLEMKKNHGDEELKARDLFYALWIPDLFMERVKEKNGKWSLFCPHECPGLSDYYGEDFVRLYEKYEAEGRAKKTMLARELWFKILDAQMETGTPYLLYKDAANRKSNQNNLGTIKSSNLCVVPETLILTDQGNKPIGELEGESVNVWNGEEYSEVIVMKTGTNQQIIKVICRHNPETEYCLKILECTPYHKFYKEDGTQVSANQLEPGMRLLGCTMPNAKLSYEYLEVVTVCDEGRISDTYCFTEPKRHMGVFNGMLTGQCTEIIEYSDDKETAVCNLASIGLPTFVNTETNQFDYDKLHEVAKVVTYNLNRVIDINFYPTEKTKLSNLRHRPIGIGVQGLADTFILMDIPFHSDEAKLVNKLIFETIYHAALEKSNEIAIQRKHEYDELVGMEKMRMLIGKEIFLPQNVIGSYSSFVGSPSSKGILQFDMWSITPSNRYDWAALKKSIVENGLRNSLLIAPMPTASTSQILGYNECFEPFTSNIYTRRTLAGEFVIVNKYLMNELIQLGIWNEQLKNNIVMNKGSIQHLTMLPEHIRNKYKIVWEIPMKHIIDMSADRGAFICQSQSLNLWMEEPVYGKLTSMHFYAWEKGLKTGIYYLRRKAKHQAQQFTIEPEAAEKKEDHEDDICEMCSA